jgi:hypothetical protein
VLVDTAKVLEAAESRMLTRIARGSCAALRQGVRADRRADEHDGEFGAVEHRHVGDASGDNFRCGDIRHQPVQPYSQQVDTLDAGKAAVPAAQPLRCHLGERPDDDCHQQRRQQRFDQCEACAP